MNRTMHAIAVGVFLIATAARGAGAESVLQQYRSGGHALGFRPDGYFVSNGTYALGVSFEGARAVLPSSDDAVADRAPGATIPELGRVAYAGLWPGVSVRFDTAGGGIARSTWTLEPGADAAAIRLRYNRAVRVTEAGELSVDFDVGTMSESRPVAWQDVDGRTQAVEVAFARLEENLVGFRIGAYRPDLPLTIDPTLTWHTFLGGSSSDHGRGIAVDGNGNVYVTGYSNAAWGSPVRSFTSGTDAFVAKLTSTGALSWHTFLGGVGDDSSAAIAVDGGGDVYIAGSSNASWGSPVRAFTDGYGDAFAAKVSSAGALTWITFLGGTGFDTAVGIAVDGSANIYVTGHSTVTWGSPIRAHADGYDALVAKLDSAGSLIWNTFLGGSDWDYGNAIAVDGGGNVYVAGSSTTTWGSPVHTYAGGDDAFVARLTSAGAITWSTFLGGNRWDAAYGIAVDASANVYVTGISSSTWGSPIHTYAGGDDSFAAKLDSAGTLTWNTFLGGSGSDSGNGIAVDGSGDVYVAGFSSTTWGSPTRSYTSGKDAFAAKLDSNGVLTWNTFLGGSGDDYAYPVAMEGSGSVYVAGFSDGGWGEPVRAYTGHRDAVAMKVTSTGALTWNTFLGGHGSEEGKAIAVDGDGNVYVAGSSNARWGEPVRGYSAGIDAFAAKLSPTGALTWTTFLGGSSDDAGYGIAVDGSGNVYVAGDSKTAWGEPVRAFTGVKEDAFAAKLDSAGVLTWNTFLGGSSNDGGYGIAVDGSGNVYVAGYSNGSWGEPVRAYTPGPDAFAAKLDSTGALIWNTFLGGSWPDVGGGIAVDGSGNVYVAGYSNGSWGSPVRAHSGLLDAFAAKLDSAGTLTWNTFLGGSSNDGGYGIAVDGSGNVYVAGDSAGTWGSPVHGYVGGGMDAFVAKLTVAGEVTWNTFLGGSGEDHGKGIAVDGSGNVYVAGGSTATWGDPVRAYTDWYDALVAKLNSDGALTWNTFLGGSGSDSCGGITVDAGGNVYAGGYSEATWGSPVHAHSGSRDVFVAKISPDDPPTHTPKNTETQTPANTETHTPKNTETQTPANTETHTPKNTETQAPSNTATATPTDWASATMTETSTRSTTATSSLTAMPVRTPTPTTRVAACPGDCTQDGEVTINDIVAAMGIALRSAPLAPCSPADVDGSGAVSIDELVQMVKAALHGCGSAARLPLAAKTGS